MYNNGDIEYLTPLQEVNVEAFASDYQLIPRAKTAYRFVGDSQTDTEIKKAYQAYKERNKITE